MKTRVKVKRSELQRVVDGRLRKAEKEHERAVAAYPQRRAEWEAKLAQRLRKLTAEVERGKVPSDTFRYVHDLLSGAPTKPSNNGRELCNLRRIAATLKMGAEDSILLSQEDANEYFGPCPL